MRPRLSSSSLPWSRLLAELGVIVAGVLIALAADSWWERRQEQNQAKEYLRQLLVDVQKTERQLQATIIAESERAEKVQSLIGRALGGPLPPADSLELPTGYNQFEPLTGTLAALVQGGDLRLFHNDTVRFELIAFSTVIEETRTILRHTETLIWNSTERLAIGRARHSRSGGRWGQIDVAGALNDPEILAAMQLQATATQIRLFNLRRLEKPTSRILRLITAELEQEPSKE